MKTDQQHLLYTLQLFINSKLKNGSVALSNIDDYFTLVKFKIHKDNLKHKAA